MPDFSEKVTLVTGASSGLGAHFARVLAKRGHRLVLGARQHKALTAVREEIVAAGGHADCVLVDVASPESVDAAFAAIDKLGLQCDLVINNAGIADAKPALEISPDDWDRVLDTNLK